MLLVVATAIFCIVAGSLSCDPVAASFHPTNFHELQQLHQHQHQHEKNNDHDEYWRQRARILQSEEKKMLGGDMSFERNERLANKLLMDAKTKEIDDGFRDPKQFLPAQSFLRAASSIRKSPVFQIIEDMPKGAVLHAHDTAIVSSEYVFWNITYRPNLYVCEIDGQLKFHFFAPGDAAHRPGCDWTLLQEMRKYDQHRTVDYRIAQQLTMVTRNAEQAYANVDEAWSKFMSIFIFLGPMLTYRPVFEDYFYQGLLEFYNDNIIYLELRTVLPTLYDLDGKQYGPIEVARIYKQVADRFCRDYPDFVGVKLIYAPLRNVQERQLEEFLSTARELVRELPDFVAGFDLVGQEDKGVPLVEFAEQLRGLGNASATPVHLFFHAGETNWYGTSTDENLLDAILLDTKRIGHGYAVLKHPELLEMIREKGIAIEVAPISNQVLSLVKDMRNHPAAALFAGDYPVVVSNDDPGLWGAQGLSYDFYEAFVGIMSRNADLRALKKLALNSINYSSMTQDQKIRAMDIWRRRWDAFVARLIESMINRK
ncbi:adenosine deaminase 2-like [Trichogramma pretiosum]|uniref:adenosine deaminase 2-like n=1 Tax=Trichogramma pretiosum TaxID=7493 RepID=UPI0006C99B12|nr:adenosine deaminase 2-like [Trichogramma pretiosum]